ncbi:MAG: GNAT family N-acetyltransferase [Thermoplasmatales archaeon]
MEIRVPESIEEYRALENLQREIWGMRGETPVPSGLMRVISHNGGLVEIALDEGKIIGFTLAFPGSEGGRRFLYSHMAGVLKEYRNMGVGYELKIHQFSVAKKMGYNEVRWAFDPIKVRNAYFNVHKLGAYAYNYIINYYGEMDSDENRGVESDRYEAHKFLDRDIIRPREFDVVGKITNFPEPWDGIKVGPDSVALEVPMNLGSPNIELAVKWRLKLREAILQLEKENYAVNDVIRNEKTVYLVLTRKDLLNLE